MYSLSDLVQTVEDLQKRVHRLEQRNKSKKNYAWQLRSCECNVSLQIDILQLLNKYGRLYPTKIGKLLGKPRPGVNHVLTVLMQEEFVDKGRLQQKRHAGSYVWYWLTPKGQQIVDAANSIEKTENTLCVNVEDPLLVGEAKTIR